MQLLRVGPLPQEALAAAARFHADVLPGVLDALRGAADLVLVWGRTDHSHRGWQLAVVQGLAREHAPIRVNAVVCEDESAIAAAVRYLAAAPGVTGQLLPLDGTGAGEIHYLSR